MRKTMTGLDKILREWIRYLKNNQIVHLESDPKTNKLRYKRPVRVEDLFYFIEKSSDFADEQIASAIQSVIGRKGPTSTSDNQQRLPGPRQPAGKQTSPEKSQQRLPGPRRSGEKGQLSTTRVNGGSNSNPGTRSLHQQNPAWLPNTNNQQKQSSNDVTDIEYKDVTADRKKLHTKLKTPGTPGTKPRYSYKGLREDIRDLQGVELSEDDVEKIFSLLIKSQSAASFDDTTNSSSHNNSSQGQDEDHADEVSNDEEIQKIKSIIDKTMTPEYRKMLWELLNKDTINEETVSRDTIKDILRSASSYSSFRATKEKVSFKDLHDAWLSAGAPLDTDKIRSILIKQFKFSEKGIDKIFSNVLTPDSDSEYDNYAASPEETRVNRAVEKIANYIIKNGYAEEIKAYLEQNYSKEIKSLMTRITDLGKRAFNKFAKKKATYEDVKNLFLKIVEENLQPDSSTLRYEEKIKLGRNKK